MGVLVRMVIFNNALVFCAQEEGRVIFSRFRNFRPLYYFSSLLWTRELKFRPWDI